ncbi:GxxExxY protein [Opitutus sp. GAS368]|jgi:GxxExxY protein|uniref:GxxExxY protein n=1 Tax=Opitutus sp. GAS368 TaxID=1882749 RepID=UPI00087A5A75|nr:GxxExxY protein [Opitutus sp. GAS368]SDS28429.1 GxxExxY protein [Opitutus sp. GAS368]
MKDLIYAEECYRIIGAGFEVYKDKGSGFLEAVFQECLELEFGLQQIAYAAQRPLALSYKGHALRQSYVADFVCYDKIIVELKAVEKLADEHRAQLLNYLNATGLRLGLLINFGHHPKLEWERMVL